MLFFLHFSTTAMLHVEALQLSQLSKNSSVFSFWGYCYGRAWVKSCCSWTDQQLKRNRRRECQWFVINYMRWLLSSIYFACSYLKFSGWETFDRSLATLTCLSNLQYCKFVKLLHVSIIMATITGLMHISQKLKCHVLGFLSLQEKWKGSTEGP